MVFVLNILDYEKLIHDITKRKKEDIVFQEGLRKLLHKYIDPTTTIRFLCLGQRGAGKTTTMSYFLYGL